jgi:hypothetical protein
LRKNLKAVIGLVLAVVVAASMWFYFDRILVAHQVQDAQLHGRPRGNLSDLYPRWLGARELLLHHRNPYSREVTLEIQEGYYGRRLDDSRPTDPKDQQGFAYPAYVVFLLAPLVSFPFHDVQVFFYWFLLGLTAASVGLWLRALCWRWPPTATAVAILMMLGSVPAVQGLKLQQMSLLAAALLASSAACVAGDFLFCGGGLLALATIKPQLTWALAAWLLLWAVSDWRKRRSFVFGFALVMWFLLLGAEVILPGWWRMFAAALQQYHRYTQNQSVLDQLVPWAFSGKLLAMAALTVSASFLWKLRSVTADTAEFGLAIALVMALTVLVVPMYAPYNQVLLLPAVLVLLRERSMFVSGSHARRFAYVATAFALTWQWIASLALIAVYWVASPAQAREGWKWPFFVTFAVPVLIFALIFVDVQNRPRSLAVSTRDSAG